MLLLSPLTAVGVGTAPASAATSPTFHVTQAGQCYEVTPIGDGTVSAEEFYDYRAGAGTKYGSYGAGSQAIQENQVSHLFLYSGSEGLSLVMLHDDLNQSEGGAITFDIAGLPSDREWLVEDDDYQNRDDNFDHAATSSSIDWMWSNGRTDGAIVRGMSADFDAITIDPAFGEQSWAYQERSPQWPDATDDLSWELQSGDGTEIPLDKGQQVSISKGSCPDTTDPSAALSASPSTVETGESVTFDASGSDGTGTAISEYRWDFDGDGNVDETTTAATVTHSYANASSYDATVTVVDGGGNTDSATASVTVEETVDDTPPDAKASVSPDTVSVGESATFDGSGSSDDTGIVSYEWSFDDGDTATGETVTHAFDSAGDHTATLTVIDAAGNNNSTTVTVTVEETETDTPPTARIEAPDWAFMNEGASFSASGSTDDDAIVSYHWQFDDGDTATGEEVTHAFDSTGEHTVTLTVTDTAGKTDSTTATVEIREEDLNSPTADLTASKTTVEVGESVGFDASNSSDEESGIEFYHWNFDGDNQFEETTESPTNTHAFSAPGEYQVEVMVEDNGTNGLTDTASVDITVQEADDEPTIEYINATAVRIDGDFETVFVDSTFFDSSGVGTSNYDLGPVSGTTVVNAREEGVWGPVISHVAVHEGDLDSPQEAAKDNPNFDAQLDAVRPDRPSTFVENATKVSDGTYEVTFGYVNPNDEMMVGGSEFTSGSATPAPPTEFEPGRHTFTVTWEPASNDSNLVWETDFSTFGYGATTATSPTPEQIGEEPTETAPPTAVIDVPATVTVGEQFTASGSDSTDDNGIVSYHWQFDDGTTKTGETVTHTYDSASLHTVTLTVTDAAGKTDTTTATFMVEESEPPSNDPPENVPPKADFSIPESSPLSEKFHLDASGSEDDKGIAAYKWDFDSDGTYEHTFTDQSGVWVVPWKDAIYGQAGTYDVTLTVVDEEGETDSVTKTVTIEQKDHTKPTATIDAPNTVTVGEQFELRATEFSEGNLAHICWVFSANGHGEEHGPEGKTATWSFDSTGEKTVQVVLRDRAGNQHTVETTITVVADSGSDPKDPTPSDPGPSDPENPDEGGLGDEPPKGSTGGSVPAANPPSNSNGDSAAKTAPITESFGDDLGTISLKTGSGDASVATNATVPQNVREPAFEDGFAALSYLQITGDAKRMTFTVDQDRLANESATVDEVNLFRFENGSWSAVEVEQLETKGDAYRFRTIESVSGTYAVGLDQPSISVADLSLAETRIDADGSTELTVTLSNDGRANGTFEAILTVGGNAVVAKPVEVAAGETREVTFDVSADAPGIYTVGVGDATTSLTIAGIETETTTETTTGTATTVPDVTETNDESTGTVPGFGVAAALLALALAAFVATRKR